MKLKRKNIPAKAQSASGILNLILQLLTVLSAIFEIFGIDPSRFLGNGDAA